MKKFMAIAIVLMMVFSFGIAITHAQQTETKKAGCPMMSKSDCPMTSKSECPTMAEADGMKCMMGENGKCPMSADNCPMPTHHGSKTSTVPDHGAA